MSDRPSNSAAVDGMEEGDVDPSQYLKMQPKKSILKAKQASSLDGKEGRAHFDEMNIIATYHPADKDYGMMKIDEPKTPYHFSDAESESEEVASASRGRRVSLVGPIDPSALAEGISSANQDAHVLPVDTEDSDEESEERRAKRAQFEQKRKAHYNEGAVLKQHLPIDDDDDEMK